MLEDADLVYGVVLTRRSPQDAVRGLGRLFREEQGFALVITLGVTVVLSMMVVSVIESARSNSHNAILSVGRGSAYDLAEAGVNNAMSVLRTPANNALDDYVF